MSDNGGEFTRYVILLSHTGKPMTESIIRAHVKHLKRLEDVGRLVLCGPFKGYQGGMVIVRADSYEAAKKIAEADPFIREGVESFELRTWELSCKENNHLGMG